VLIDLSMIPDTQQAMIRRIRLAAPRARIIGLHTAGVTPGEEHLAGGADEYIVSPVADALKRAVERLAEEQARLEFGTPRGKSICFLSAKGGCGATTLACHVAVELSRVTQGVLLADLDVNNGMVAFLLKSRSPYSIADALNNVQRLDASYWKALVSNSIPGLDLISAPATISAELTPKPESLRQVLAFTSRQYEWTVADAGHGLNPYTRAAFESADEACLVTTPEIPALHQAREILQQLLDGGFRKERLRLVLNRYSKTPGMGPEELQKMMGVPLYAVLPDAYPELHDALSHGQLLPAGADLGRQIGRLARKLAGIAEQTAKRKSPFWMKAS
jgi:pilus assembly protein CpaE